MIDDESELTYSYHMRDDAYRFYDEQDRCIGCITDLELRILMRLLGTKSQDHALKFIARGRSHRSSEGVEYLMKYEME